MSPKRHPFRSWAVAGGLIAAVAVALGTIGDATSTWHDFLVWVNRQFRLGEQSFLLSHEKLLFLLALLVGAVLLGLLKWIGNRLSAPPRRRISPRGQTKEERTRAAYLAYLEEDVNGRLAASIHRARFLDLGLDETQGATLPWHYVHHDPDAEAQVFTSIDQAFDGFKRRLLLLGAPGAGKSTTLLHLAKRLLEEAKNNPEAPIPVLLNLSSYKGPVPKRRLPFRGDWQEARTLEGMTAFDQWLIQQLEGLPVRDIRKFAQSWVEEGRVALLLDGLDEVGESRVKDLIRDLNESFFWRHPDLPAVICSRIFEYQKMTADREMRLRLRGAVSLQSLTPEQIDVYLAAARAEGLREALVGDVDLRELARTPLTLSMMVLAYGGLAPTEIPANLPLVERRRHLFDIYVARMLQRKERRDRGVPFDLNAEADAPLRYSLDRVNRYLGWLAVRLSERSLTGFRPEGMASFLNEELQLQHGDSAQAPVQPALFLLTTCLSLFTATIILYLGDEPLTLALVLGIVVPLGAFCTWMVIEKLGYDNFVASLLAVLPLGFFYLFFGLISQSIYQVLPFPSDPLWAGLLTLSIGGFALVGSFYGLKILAQALVQGAVWTLVVFSVLWAMGLKDLFLWAPIPGCAFVLSYVVSESHEGWARYVWALLLMLPMALLSWSGTFVMSTVGMPSTALVTIMVCFGLGFIMSLGEGHLVATALCLGLSVGSVIGMAWGGPSAVPLVSLVALLISWKLSYKSALVIEKYLINPFLFAVLSLQRRVPLYFGRFIEYAVGAMLLKRSGEEYEFVHRLLRDHFAVREQIPFLYTTDGRARPEVIERLSLLGEASLDSLAGLTLHPDESIRLAAVAGLERITTPGVTPVLARVVSRDGAPGVRARAVRALGGYLSEDAIPIIENALLDPAPEVRTAVMEVVAGSIRYHRFARMAFQGLKDPDDQVFASAIQTLASGELSAAVVGMINLEGTASVVARIRSLLKDSSASTRRVALTLVGLLRDKESLPEVQAALAAKDQKVRMAAFLALGQISGPEVIPFFMPLLRNWREDTRKVAVEALLDILSRCDSQHLPDEVRAALLRALRDRSPGVRAGAAMALRFFRHPTVEEALRRAEKDRDMGARWAAKASLELLKRENRS
jgi:HEAT repeat protein/DNA polymerase III delta prime subunit